MIYLLSVVQVTNPSFEMQLFWGVMFLGEVIGRILLELCGTKLLSVTRVWSLAFEDEVKERLNVSKSPTRK